MRKTFDYIVGLCKLATHVGVGPVPGYVPGYDREDTDEFYGPRQNPYEQHLREIQVEYDPSSRNLILIPRQYGSNKDMLSITLTPQQANVFDYFEDVIHQQKIYSNDSKNRDALTEFADAKIKEFGLKEWHWYPDEQELILFPDFELPSKERPETVKYTAADLAAMGVSVSPRPARSRFTVPDVEAFVKGICRFAESRFAEYGPDNDPYEEYLFKSTVRFDPSTLILTIQADERMNGYDEKRIEDSTVRMTLTPQQAAAFDKFEDMATANAGKETANKNEAAVEDFAEKYFVDHGLAKYWWTWDNEVLTLHPPWSSKGQAKEIVFTKQQLEQAGVKFLPMPTRRTYQKPRIPTPEM